jgi:hypothetical protein
MSSWGSAKARHVLKALLKSGWVINGPAVPTAFLLIRNCPRFCLRVS